MAKRFTDTEKWKKPFIRTMKAPYKLLWIYILDECDHAGIWEVDFEVAQIKIGEKLNIEMARIFFAGKIVEINGKWFLPDFIDFQYGILNETNRVHKSVIQLLKKHDLLDEFNFIKPLASPLQDPLEGVKDKEQVKDKVKDKEKDIPLESDFLEYCKTILREKYPGLEFSLKAKYISWKENNWKDGNQQEITNWKTKILNVIPFLKNDTANRQNNGSGQSRISVPPGRSPGKL